MKKHFLISILLLFSLNNIIFSKNDFPNFILIFTDDQGYGDLSCFGSQRLKLPILTVLPKTGESLLILWLPHLFVHHHEQHCTLLDDTLKRTGMHQHVLFPSSEKGLNPKEYTMADHFFKSLAGATACFGKWHLGHHKQVLPHIQWVRYIFRPFLILMI